MMMARRMGMAAGQAQRERGARARAARLPDELVGHIMSFLDADSLRAASCVCRAWCAHADAGRGALWKAHCLRRWPHLRDARDVHNSYGGDWRRLYIDDNDNNLTATYTWDVSDFASRGAERIVSPPFSAVFRGDAHTFQLHLDPRGNPRQSSADGSHLSLYLATHRPAERPAGFITSAGFTLEVVHRTDPARSVRWSPRNPYGFRAGRTSWGTHKLASLETVCNPASGFLDDTGALRLRALVCLRYATLELVTAADMAAHVGLGVADISGFDGAAPRDAPQGKGGVHRSVVVVPLIASAEEIVAAVAEKVGAPADGVRLWGFSVPRDNCALRPRDILPLGVGEASGANAKGPLLQLLTNYRQHKHEFRFRVLVETVNRPAVGLAHATRLAQSGAERVVLGEVEGECAAERPDCVGKAPAACEEVQGRGPFAAASPRGRGAMPPESCLARSLSFEDSVDDAPGSGSGTSGTSGTSRIDAAAVAAVVAARDDHYPGASSASGEGGYDEADAEGLQRTLLPYDPAEDVSVFVKFVEAGGGHPSSDAAIDGLDRTHAGTLTERLATREPALSFLCHAILPRTASVSQLLSLVRSQRQGRAGWGARKVVCADSHARAGRRYEHYSAYIEGTPCAWDSEFAARKAIAGSCELDMRTLMEAGVTSGSIVVVTPRKEHEPAAQPRVARALAARVERLRAIADALWEKELRRPGAVRRKHLCLLFEALGVEQVRIEDAYTNCKCSVARTFEYVMRGRQLTCFCDCGGACDFEGARFEGRARADYDLCARCYAQQSDDEPTGARGSGHPLTPHKRTGDYERHDVPEVFGLLRSPIKARTSLE